MVSSKDKPTVAYIRICQPKHAKPKFANFSCCQWTSDFWVWTLDFGLDNRFIFLLDELL